MMSPFSAKGRGRKRAAVSRGEGRRKGIQTRNSCVRYGLAHKPWEIKIVKEG